MQHSRSILDSGLRRNDEAVCNCALETDQIPHENDEEPFLFYKFASVDEVLEWISLKYQSIPLKKPDSRCVASIFQSM